MEKKPNPNKEDFISRYNHLNAKLENQSNPNAKIKFLLKNLNRIQNDQTRLSCEDLMKHGLDIAEEFIEIDSRHQQAKLEVEKSNLNNIEKTKALEKANNELEEALEKAKESDKLKTAFLANMSHEIRTPLNGIVGFTELLNKDNIPKDKREKYIKLVNKSVDQLVNIISDILDISKLESGILKINENEFNLNEAMQDVYNQILLYLKNINKSDLQFKLEKGLNDFEAQILSDPYRLKQVLSNLLNNAIKFTKQGSVSFGYKLKDKNTLIFYVKDTGIGINPEFKKQIFDRFWQVETPDTRKFGGTGLGLSISNGIVNLLGGKIWVESSLSAGSAFYFEVPYKPTSNKEIKLITKHLPDMTFLKNKTILIVEDEIVNFLYLQEILEETESKILHVENGIEAVETVKNNKDIDIILMDIQLPELNGLEATKRIRDFNKKIPIIAQTAYAQLGDREKCLKIGCNSYLSKPIRPEMLFDEITRFLN